jgi:hypothetical protein
VEHARRDRKTEGAGCAFHPSKKTHARMAEEMATVVMPLLARD